MESLREILLKLKTFGCVGVKISFEDEGALYNEIVTMSNLTSSVGIDLSIKIGGCEAKRDIVDCLNVNCNAIVGPMIESKFALGKFIKSVKGYNYNKKKGFNLETICGYNNLLELTEYFDQIDFVTFGRVDFVGSLNKDREFADTNEIYNYVEHVFTEAKKYNLECYMGGAVSINSKQFINKLYKNNLLDKFETRYIIFETKQINFDNFDEMLYYANFFEVEWMKYISERYCSYSNKDKKRILMIEERLSKNILN